MLTKARTKFLLFLAGLTILLGSGALAVFLVTQFVAAFQHGADPASIFRGHSLLVPQPEEARWQRIAAVTGETPRRSQLDEMLSAYWVAWEALDRAYATGNSDDLPTYWAGEAYHHALKSVTSGTIQAQRHYGHNLYLSFFSDDGSIVAFSDQGFILEKHQGDYVLQISASATVVMTLDNGFWRIRSLTLHYY